MYEAGVIALLAIFTLLIKFPRHWLRRMLWLDIPLDILVTMGLVSILMGTYSGMMAALAAGLFFSIILLILKFLIGYERIEFDHDTRQLSWVKHPGWLDRHQT